MSYTRNGSSGFGNHRILSETVMVNSSVNYDKAIYSGVTHQIEYTFAQRSRVSSCENETILGIRVFNLSMLILQ